MKANTLLICTLLITLFSFGQACNRCMFYEEYFTDQVGKGATGSTTDMTGVDWTIDISGAAFNNNNSRFGVVNTGPVSNINPRFEAKALIGTAIWMSPEIDIYSFSDVAFSIYVLEKNNSDNLEDDDTLEVQYKLDDDDDWTQASTNGFYFNDFLHTLTEQEGLNGTTLQLRVIIKNNGSGEWHQFDGIKVSGSPKNFSYTTSGWSPSNAAKITTLNPISIETGEAIISTDITCESLTVKPGASMTIASTKTLTTTNGITLQSSSSSYSSLVLNGSIVGDVNYERHASMMGSGLPGTGGNDLISIPLMPSAGQSFDTFIGLGAPANSTKLATNGTVYAFGPYDNNSASPAYINYAVAATDALIKGKGYRAATIASDQVLTFTGAVEPGNVSIPITSPTVGSQWNLVGNPYPSYLSASEFLTANSAVLDAAGVAIYGYNSGTTPLGTGSATTGNFTIINNATTANDIAPGQGFLVAAKNATGDNIVFNNGSSGTTDMRLVTGSDDYIVGRSSTPNYNFRLDLIGSTAYSTSFYFNENSSLGLDPGYDAKVYGTVPAFAIYSHLVEANTGINFALQSLNTLDISNVTIPLGVNANQGEQITFTIAQSTLPSTVDVYLEDTVANTSTLLTTSDYVMTPISDLSGTGRFYLRLADQALSTTDTDFDAIKIYTTPSPRAIFVHGMLTEDTTANIYDLQGRLVYSAALDSTRLSHQIDASDFADGVYVVTLSNGVQEKSQKVIIR